MKNNQFWEKTYTPVRFPKAVFSLGPEEKTAFWGSCFAQELGNLYRELDLISLSSPFGIIYNPLTIADSLSMLIHRELRGEPFLHAGLWRHDGFHSSCCYKGKEYDGAKEFFLQAIENGYDTLKSINTLIITLGTAYVYQRIENSSVVNNCHRQPNTLFRRLAYKDCPHAEDALLNGLKELKGLNKDVRIILTVSPVRHLRDDARENSYSKSLLRCLCEELSQSESYIHYFPSYEIVLDELRDYRWYGQDLCHPTKQAVEYVMERFWEWCASKELIDYIKAKKKERKHNSHRPHF